MLIKYSALHYKDGVLFSHSSAISLYETTDKNLFNFDKVYEVVSRKMHLELGIRPRNKMRYPSTWVTLIKPIVYTACMM